MSKSSKPREFLLLAVSAEDRKRHDENEISLKQWKHKLSLTRYTAICKWEILNVLRNLDTSGPIGSDPFAHRRAASHLLNGVREPGDPMLGHN